MSDSDPPYYSPAEVSQALGVSTSTVKRWVDQGVLPAHRTPGGHRKLLRPDVLRLVREGSFPQCDLGRLGLPPAAAETDASALAECLFEALRQGDLSLIRGTIHGAYAAGLRLEVLADEVIAPAMARLGRQWEEGRIDVMHEHRATSLCSAVLHELRPSLESTAAADRPVAVGGNPEGDHSTLASQLIQLILLDAGWDAVNLGPHTPLASFRVALGELRPRLVWLSVAYLADRERFAREYRAFHDEAAHAGAAVALGGLALDDALRGTLPAACLGTRLGDLARLAETLYPRSHRPRRGRPARQTP